MAYASLVLGLIGLIAWWVPILGVPPTALGLVFGLNRIKSEQRKLAITGSVLSGIGLGLSLLNGVAGYLIGAGVLKP